MADAGKEASEAVTAQPTATAAPSPTPKAQTVQTQEVPVQAGYFVKCAHPTSRFVANADDEEFPVITKRGVTLSADQLEVAKEAAERSAVRLIVEGEDK